ncbi:MAG: hypothetical protein AAF242_21390 [Bacteroidota bacterium]
MAIRLKSIFFYAICIVFFSSCNAQDDATAQIVPDFTTEEQEIIRQAAYFSTDQGYTWTPMTKGLPGYTEGSFLDTFGEELLLATDNVGLFVTTNGRSQWKNISGQLPSSKINAIWTEGEQIYAGVYKAGIYTTDDLGKTWTDITYNLDDKRVQAIRIINGRLYVGTDSGIAKLNPKTQTWIPLYTGTQILSLEHLDGRIIAGASRGTLISTQNDTDWQWANEYGAVHYTRLLDETIFALQINGNLHRSTDLGSSWQNISYQPQQRSYIYEVVGIGDELILSNNHGLHRSSDNGQSWKLYQPNTDYFYFDIIEVDGILYSTTRN